MKSKIGRQEGIKSRYNLALIADSIATLHTNKGNYFSDVGKLEEAEKEYNLALADDPKNLAAHSNYAILLSKIGRLKEAEEHYITALEINPKNHTNNNNCGYILDKMNKLEEAEKHYKLALKIDPQNIATHANYGVLLHRTDRLGEAEKHYKFILNTTLEIKEINCNYINLLYETDRLRDGIKQCEIILKNNPNDADIHFLYGFTMSSLSDFSDRKIKKEMDLASRLMEGNGNQAYMHSSRGTIYAALANRYYQYANKYHISDHYLKSWRYAEKSGEEYIEASKYVGEESKGNYLTVGYMHKGRAKVREVAIYSPSDITSFKKIVLGIYEASEFYKKASDASSSENKFCNACYISMSVFAEILQSMKGVIEKETFPQLEEKIPEWKNKLIYPREVCKGNNKLECFLESLHKAMTCIQNLKAFKEDALPLDEIPISNCIIELMEAAKSIEGPLQKIVEISAIQMNICREQISLNPWNGTLTPYINLPEPKPSDLKKIRMNVTNIFKLIAKPIISLIVIIITAVIAIILAPHSKEIVDLFNTFVSTLSKYLN